MTGVAVAGLAFALLPSPALAAAPLSWSSPVSIDQAPPYLSSNVAWDVSCPSASLCVAVDEQGNVVTSSDPLGPAITWQKANIDGTRLIRAVSCPTVSLCVAVDSNGDVVTSTDPTGGPGAWTISPVEPPQYVGAVSCPSPSLCVAGDDDGNLLVSTNPTGGASAFGAPTELIKGPLRCP